MVPRKEDNIMVNKSCRLITFHTPVNYGAVLQATALFTYVSKSFTNTQIIDYDTKQLRKKYPLFRKSKGIVGCFWFVHDLCHLASSLTKKYKFRLFLKKHCKFTKKYKTFHSIKQSFFDCDFLITGSDQVFRPNRDFEERNIFYLDLNTNAKKLSYAASFGGVDVEKDNAEEIMGYLSSFSYVSVREKSGLDTLNKIGFSGELVIDPVFLLDKNEWKNSFSKKNIKKTNYILYYALIDNPTYHKYVECLSHLLRKQVIVIGSLNFKPFKRCKYVRACGPKTFISLVEGADYVFTSSFHGVAFSLIFGKQFFSIEEDPILKNRANDLMNKLGIPYLDFFEVLEKCKSGALNYIDYNAVYPKLNYEIIKSKKFLDEALEVK